MSAVFPEPIQEAWALISEQLKDGPRPLLAIHAWWVDEMKRPPALLREAIAALIKSGVAVGEVTDEGAKMLRLTEESKPETPIPPTPERKRDWLPGVKTETKVSRTQTIVSVGETLVSPESTPEPKKRREPLLVEVPTAAIPVAEQVRQEGERAMETGDYVSTQEAAKRLACHTSYVPKLVSVKHRRKNPDSKGFQWALEAVEKAADDKNKFGAPQKERKKPGRKPKANGAAPPARAAPAPAAKTGSPPTADQLVAVLRKVRWIADGCFVADTSFDEAIKQIVDVVSEIL